MKLHSLLCFPLLALPALALQYSEEGWFEFDYRTDSAGDLLPLAGRRSICFHNSTMMYLSPKMLNKFGQLESLHVAHGSVKKIYVKPTLDYILVAESNTEDIVIDSKGEYQTTYLEVSSCLLTSTPKNLERLKLLKALLLKENHILSIDMSSFNNLGELKFLSLVKNNVKVLFSSNPINLPKLNQLRISSNRISELNVCQWTMITLEELHLHENRLPFVVNLANQFPKLATISLHGNPLHCDWKRKFLDDVADTRKHIKLYENSEPTCATRMLGFFHPSPTSC